MTGKHDNLNLKIINNYLGDRSFNISLFDEVTSTNTLLKQAVKDGARVGTTYVADCQTAGKGRLSRKFISPKGNGLYFSTYLKTQGIEPLFSTVVASLSVVNAIKEICGVDSQIKWVNDIYIDSKKCCGILCEGLNASDRVDGVIIGIGLNVTTPNGGFDDEIKDIATAVCKKSKTHTRNQLLASILRHLSGYFECFNKEKIVREYREKSCVISKVVTVLQNGESRFAKVLDIDDECRLVVEYENGEIDSLSTGEISVRV